MYNLDIMQNVTFPAVCATPDPAVCQAVSCTLYRIPGLAYCIEWSLVFLLWFHGQTYLDHWRYTGTGDHSVSSAILFLT